MSTSSKPQHRTPAKSTPFSNGTTRSRSSRSAMTTTLRKAKRCQMVQMKRHMKLGPVAAVGGNPYQRVDDQIKETISVAESIVRCCQEPFNDSSIGTLSTSLEKLCLLITPTDFDDSTKIGDTKQRDGASYDSSLAGIAANAILTHPIQQQQPSNEKSYLAFHLADALAMILNTNTQTTSTLQSVQIQAAIALTQLSATEPPPPPMTSLNQEEYSPYGHPSQDLSSMLASAPTSWCHVVVNSQALQALIHKMSTKPSTKHDVEITEKCAWAIGNLAGDSEMAREALFHMEAVTKLIGCVCFGLSVLSSSKPCSDMQGSLISLLRNSIWALVNFVREGMVCMTDLMDVNSSRSSEKERTRLSSQDFALLLMLPESVHEVKGTDPNKATCHNVVTETCWLLAFLLEKDHTAVEFICRTDTTLIPAILTALALVTDAASQLGAQQHASGALLCLVPVCRVLRNIACDERYVSSILPEDIFLKSKQVNLARPTQTCLAKLISLGATGAGPDASTIASKAAETAGACLLHAGLAMSHPSTVACQILIPALCQTLTNQSTAFEVKREVVWALSNAIRDPFEYSTEMEASNNDEEFQSFQLQLLMEIANTSDIFESLIALLMTMDMDVMESSICLIDAMLRKLNLTSSGKKLSVVLEEKGLVGALWRICDSDTNESDVAEMAANILDTFYEDEEFDIDEDEILAPSSAGGSFQFQAPSSIVGGFDFSSNNSSGFAFNNNSHGEQVEQRPPMG